MDAMVGDRNDSAAAFRENGAARHGRTGVRLVRIQSLACVVASALLLSQGATASASAPRHRFRLVAVLAIVPRVGPSSGSANDLRADAQAVGNCNLALVSARLAASSTITATASTRVA